jgi:hypothetical protein
MRKLLLNIILILFLSSLGYYVYANYLTTCNRTLTYDIGDIDPRFGISEEDFENIVFDTEKIWEDPFSRNFFQYDPNAKFKINLVFDDRQQRTIDERNTRDEIATQEQRYRSLVDQYELLFEEHKQANTIYEAGMDAYQERLKKYNEQADYWNKNGGAPSKEYTALQQEKAALQRELRRLESERNELNEMVIELNSLGSQINTLAKTLNIDVSAYNGRFGTTREFDQGSYTGTAINIYQFNNNDDLRLVLAHEYGHALGLEHIDDPEAIMYYLMDKQNIDNLQLTRSDISALRSSCHIR